jgi:transmembrane sensor
MSRPSGSAREHDRDMAARFVARMDGDNWGEADEAELQHWLDGGPGRDGMLLQAHAAWIAATPEPVEEPEVAPAFWRRRGFWARWRPRLRRWCRARWMDARSSFATKLGEIRRVPWPMAAS